MIMNSSPEPSPLLPPDSSSGAQRGVILRFGKKDSMLRKLLESAEIAHSSHLAWAISAR
jgi:hypothetical protein